MGFLSDLLTGREKATAKPTLATDPAIPSPAKLEVGWATDVGQIRDHNEDSLLVMTAAQDGDHVQPSWGLFILADGMGGHRAGEVASSLAVRVTAHSITRRCYLPSLIGANSDPDRPALNEVLVAAVRAANDAVAEEVRGGGTTLTCALVLGSQAYIAHVGDSRACVVDQTGVAQITNDHSLVDRLMETGQLTPGEVAAHPRKNVLYRAVGQGSGLEVDTHVRKIAPGAHLLLCSDGLWNMVSNADIAELIREAPSLQSACEGLVAAANTAGGTDNISLVLWRPPPD